MTVHGLNGSGLKNLLSAATGDAKPLGDVAVSLQECQRASFGPQSNALAKLPKLSIVHFHFQLRLTREDDLEELCICSLEVTQEPNLFEHFERQILSLIDDQDNTVSTLILLKQPMIELDQHAALLRGIA